MAEKGGGLTDGDSHAEGGIEMTVKSTGQQIEVEGGEGIVNKKSMSDPKKKEFKGELKTNCEIISEINSADGNGVTFDCDTVEGIKYKYDEGGKTFTGYKSEYEKGTQDYVKGKKQFADSLSVHDLPESPDKYFVKQPDSILMPVSDIYSTKEPDESAFRIANNFMHDTYLGKAPARSPITVTQTSEGKYRILDGNATFENALRNGWNTIYVTVDNSVVKLAKGGGVTFEEIDAEYKSILKIYNEHKNTLTPLQTHYIGKALSEMYGKSRKAKWGNGLETLLRVKIKGTLDKLESSANNRRRKGYSGNLKDKYAYHFTTLGNFEDILTSKRIGRESAKVPDGVPKISMTTNPYFAEKEVSTVKNYGGMGINPNTQFFSDLPIKIVFNLQKIIKDGIRIRKGHWKIGTHYGEYELLVDGIGKWEAKTLFKYIAWIEYKPDFTIKSPFSSDLNPNDPMNLIEYHILDFPIYDSKKVNDKWVERTIPLGQLLKELKIKVKEWQPVDLKEYLFEGNRPKFDDGGGVIRSVNINKKYSTTITDREGNILYEESFDDYDKALNDYNLLGTNDIWEDSAKRLYGNSKSLDVSFFNKEGELIYGLDTERLEHDELSMINEETDAIVDEIRDWINETYIKQRFSAKYMTLDVISEEDEDEIIGCIKVRVADHSQNTRNNRGTPCRTLSFVISNSNPTKNSFIPLGQEYYFTGSDGIDHIKQEIKDHLEDAIDQIKWNYADGGLTPEESKLVSTPEFKEWFGDSKVVDQNGLPLVVYRTQKEKYKHGDFDYHMTRKYLCGIHFSQNKESTRIYGNTTAEYFIRMVNPKILRGIEHDEMWTYSIMTKDKCKALIDEGYDGAIWLRGGVMYEIAVLDQNQIRLADGSNFSKGGKISANPDSLSAKSERLKKETIAGKYPYRIRFNLESGDNYNKWVIENPKTKSQEYFDPSKVQLILKDTFLQNQKGTAMRVFQGERRKTPMSWVRFEDFEVVPVGTYNFKTDKPIRYNPREHPYWVNKDLEDRDKEKYDKIVSDGRSLYVQKEGRFYDVGGFVDEEEIDRPSGGDCYYASGSVALGNALEDVEYIGTPYLVHAEVQGQGQNSDIRFGHAWIEDDFMVYDYSNDRKLILPKPYYYNKGEVITDDPAKYRKYTFDEARKKMLETEHYGCWDLETEYEGGGQLHFNISKEDITELEKFANENCAEFECDGTSRALSKWLDLKGIDYIVRTGAFGNKEKHFEPHYWIETKDDEGETLIIDFKAGLWLPDAPHGVFNEKSARKKGWWYIGREAHFTDLHKNLLYNMAIQSGGYEKGGLTTAKIEKGRYRVTYRGMVFYVTDVKGEVEGTLTWHIQEENDGEWWFSKKGEDALWHTKAEAIQTIKRVVDNDLEGRYEDSYAKGGKTASEKWQSGREKVTKLPIIGEFATPFHKMAKSIDKATGGKSERFTDPIGHKLKMEKGGTTVKINRNYWVAFNLGKGKYNNWWQVDSKEQVNGKPRTKESNYYDPQTTQLTLYNCKVTNSPTRAKRIYTGEITKERISYVKCVRYTASKTIKKIDESKPIRYNPRVTPNWVNKDVENRDNFEYDEIISYGTKLYVQQDGEYYELGGVVQLFSGGGSLGDTLFDDDYDDWKKETTRKYLKGGGVEVREIFYPERSLGISRENMPQIRTRDMDTFFETLENDNISYTSKQTDPKLLKPSQKGINLSRVKRIKKEYATNKPTLVSKDNYVLDGHHRWYYLLLNDTPINTVVVDLNVREALEYMKNLPIAETQTLKRGAIISSLFEDFNVLEQSKHKDNSYAVISETVEPLTTPVFKVLKNNAVINLFKDQTKAKALLNKMKLDDLVRFDKGGTVADDTTESFIPSFQVELLTDDQITEMAKVYAETPALYTQDGLGKNAVVHIHYFNSSSDWYITEIDKETNEAFGFVVLNGDTQNAEFGYIPLEFFASADNYKMGATPEIDLYFSKATLNEIFETKYPELVSKPIVYFKKSAEESDSVDFDLLIKENQFKNPYERNMAIRKMIDLKGDDPDKYTVDEKELLSKYSGMGGLQSKGATGKGLLSEYYTPRNIVDIMWGLAYKHQTIGINNVLENSVGNGVFVAGCPQDVMMQCYDIDIYAITICRVLYPESRFRFIHDSFETVFIDKRSSVKDKVEPIYDLVIGNPPYYQYMGQYAGMGEKKYTKARNFIDYFIFRSLDLLKKDGLLVYIVGSVPQLGQVPFLEQKDFPTLTAIKQKSELIDAYRLGSGVFSHTDIDSDIIVLRKT